MSSDVRVRGLVLVKSSNPANEFQVEQELIKIMMLSKLQKASQTTEAQELHASITTPLEPRGEDADGR